MERRPGRGRLGVSCFHPIDAGRTERCGKREETGCIWLLQRAHATEHTQQARAHIQQLAHTRILVHAPQAMQPHQESRARERGAASLGFANPKCSSLPRYSRRRTCSGYHTRCTACAHRPHVLSSRRLRCRATESLHCRMQGRPPGRRQRTAAASHPKIRTFTALSPPTWWCWKEAAPPWDAALVSHLAAAGSLLSSLSCSMRERSSTM